jgi:hypothetical protein
VDWDSIVALTADGWLWHAGRSPAELDRRLKLIPDSERLARVASLVEPTPKP